MLVFASRVVSGAILCAFSAFFAGPSLVSDQVASAQTGGLPDCNCNTPHNDHCDPFAVGCFQRYDWCSDASCNNRTVRWFVIAEEFDCTSTPCLSNYRGKVFLHDTCATQGPSSPPSECGS